MDRRSFLVTAGAGGAALAAPILASAEESIYSPRGAEFLTRADEVIARGPFQDNWPSLETYSVPDWYADAKFGIFIHWGVYCVPAFMSEWYPRMMYQRNNPSYWHHLRKYGPHTKFGYKDFIPLFKAERFDAGAWADLFKKSGARYVVPVAEHHDGFAMYDCSLSDWTASEMGPRRDIIGELSKAVREREMVFGLSSHRAEHYWFYNGGMRFASDVREGKHAGLYGPAQREQDPPADDPFIRDWFARTVELIDKYEPQVLWFDWWIERSTFEPWRRKVAAYLYNRAAERGKPAALNYKNKAYPDAAAVLDLERSGLSGIRPRLWQTDTSTSFLSWGYIENNIFKTPDRIVSDLVDIVSKNGVLLLNIGPRSDGTIPREEQEIMLAVGRWLEQNGEGIYGSRPWKIFGEGPTALKEQHNYGAGEMATPKLTAKDIRFTAKAGKVYAFVMDWPDDRKVTIAALGRKSGKAGGVKSVRLLGADGKLEWSQGDGALSVTLPAQKVGEFAAGLEIIADEA